MADTITNRIIVTGASGFLGSALVKRLDKEGYAVFALTSRAEELSKACISNNVTYFDREVISTDKADELFRDGIVVNCAYPRSADSKSVAIGVDYNRRLFEKAVCCSAKAMINISSQSVYPQDRETPSKEGDTLDLRGVYEKGKYDCELLLESSCKGTKTAWTNLRMSSLIGAGFDQRVPNKLIAAAVKGDTIKVVKSSRRFGYMDVEDAVNAVIAIIKTDTRLWKSVYNVGSGEGYTVSELAQCICKAFELRGKECPPIVWEESDERGSSAVDSSLFYSDTGFEPKVTISESIIRILDNELKK